MIDLQPLHLHDERITLTPLKPEDFETLYKVASDPLIWEQHPNKDRYKRDVFEIFFKGAIESGGAFLVHDAQAREAIGSSRFYEYDAANSSMAIGYTFLAKDHWGTTYNKALKTLMLNYAFQFVNNVILHIGANNIRSQKATEKLGGIKIDQVEMEYYGEAKKLNFVYRITKQEWEERN